MPSMLEMGSKSKFYVLFNNSVKFMVSYLTYQNHKKKIYFSKPAAQICGYCNF